MRGIIQFIDGLSLWSGALVVAIVSALLTLFATQGRSLKFKWLFILSIPLLVAYVIYWSPVWFGISSDVSQADAWQPLFIIPWYLTGILFSALTVYFYTKLRRGNKVNN